MWVKKPSDLEFEKVEAKHVEGAEISWPIRAPGDAPNFSMRVVRVAPGGRIGLHEHPYEHEVYVIRGELTLDGPQGSIPASAGDVCYVEPAVTHGFTNTGSGALEFICVIPEL